MNYCTDNSRFTIQSKDHVWFVILDFYIPIIDIVDVESQGFRGVIMIIEKRIDFVLLVKYSNEKTSILFLYTSNTLKQLFLTFIIPNKKDSMTRKHII